MSDKEGWGKRIERAILLYSSANGRTSLAQVGELVASYEGRDKPYSASTVSEWTSETTQPRLTAFGAMAQVFDCDAWWLAWGVGREPVNPIAKHVQPVPRSSAAKKRRANGR